MLQAVTTFALIAAPIICTSVLVYILVRSLFDFMSATSGRANIALKGATSTVAWLSISFGLFVMFYFVAYTAAGNGSSADEGRLDAVTLLFLDLIYALIGSGLALWVRNKSGKGA
jgi:hypothetical protein